MAEPNDQMQEILDAYEKMGPLPVEELKPELARQIPLPDRAAAAVYGQNFVKKALAPMPAPVGDVQNRVIHGAADDILIRVYTPGGDKPDGGWPALVYYHGGGWVIATLDTYDSSCRAICNAAGCVVISVHYRQAPEHKWPAAPEDAFAAYKWVQGNTMRLAINGKKIAVGGESAGGNLAAVVSLMARDKNIAAPIHQLLIYPVTDLVNGPQSASAKQYASARPLNTPMLHWFYDHYIMKSSRSEEYASPLLAKSHKDLPPATIILAEIDPLRSEGEMYADKLKESGVPTSLKIYNGVTHEFFGMAGLVSEATDAVKFAAEQLKDAFKEIEKRAAA